MTDVLVDSNVLLDVLTEDPTWFDWSASALEEHAESAVLMINPIIYAEVSVRFARIEELDVALPADLFKREPLPWDAAFLAGKCFLRYRKAGGPGSLFQVCTRSHFHLAIQRQSSRIGANAFGKSGTRPYVHPRCGPAPSATLSVGLSRGCSPAWSAERIGTANRGAACSRNRATGVARFTTEGSRPDNGKHQESALAFWALADKLLSRRDFRIVQGCHAPLLTAHAAS